MEKIESTKNNIKSGEPKPITQSPKKSAYVQAEPLVGYDSLYSYFNNNLRYPEVAISDSIFGVSNAIITIEKSGKVGPITIENTLGEAFDLEIIRLIEGMPSWKAADLNSKPVQSKISIPFTFEIKK